MNKVLKAALTILTLLVLSIPFAQALESEPSQPTEVTVVGGEVVTENGKKQIVFEPCDKYPNGATAEVKEDGTVVISQGTNVEVLNIDTKSLKDGDKVNLSIQPSQEMEKHLRQDI